jgi:hypothetical protein
MTKQPLTDTISQIVDEIISELPLRERTSLANMKREDVKVLQSVFNLYVRDRIESEGEECTDIMDALWKRLWKTHRLRVVK